MLLLSNFDLGYKGFVRAQTGGYSSWRPFQISFNDGEYYWKDYFWTTRSHTLFSYAPACTVFRGSLSFTPVASGRAPSFRLPLAGYARSAARPEAPGLKAPLSGWGEPRWLLVCARRHVRLGIWPSPETAQGLPLDITYRDIACPEQESQVGVECVC